MAVNVISPQDFNRLILNIGTRTPHKFSGHWFNVIKFRNCHFIQGNVIVETPEQNILRNIAALVDEKDALSMRGIWPEIMGRPISKSEERDLVQFISFQERNDVELIIPERKLARSVRWDRFDETREFNLYCTYIYPAILDALDKISFHRLLDVGCGSGNLIREIVHRFPDADCHGLDITPANIEAAEDEGMKDIYHGDAEMVNDIIPEGRIFDVMVFSGLLNRQVTEREETVMILKESLKRLKQGGYVIITGYSSCHLSADDLTNMGIEVLQKSFPGNIFKDYFDYYLRQFYLGRRK